MSFAKFLIGFISALIVNIFLMITINNIFINSLFVALAVGVLAAKD